MLRQQTALVSTLLYWVCIMSANASSTTFEIERMKIYLDKLCSGSTA